MADLIKKTRFERPSFPQDLAIFKDVLSLPDPSTLDPIVPLAAGYQARGSFRAGETAGLRSEHLTQPSFDWLAGVLTLLEAPDPHQYIPAVHQLANSFRAASKQEIFTGYLPGRSIAVLLFEPKKLGEIWAQQAGSFRAADRTRVDERLLAQGDIGWLTANLKFLEVTEGTAARKQQAESFRASDAKLLEASQHLTQFELSWLRDVLELLAPPRLQAVFDSQRESFRVWDAERLLGVHLTQPQFSWLLAAVELFQDAGRRPAFDQLTASFRAWDAQKYQQQLYDSAKFNFSVLIRDIVGVAPAVEQLVSSFRASDAARLAGEHLTQPQFGWLDAILDIVELAPTEALQLLPLMGVGE